MYESQRSEVASFMRRVYERGLTTSLGGNISMRAGDDCVAITPSGVDKAWIQPEDIGIVGIDGENRTAHLKPSIETGMHLAVYRARPDIRAVIHAHPTMASFVASSQGELNCRILAEACQIAGVPIRVPYARQGTPELASIVAGAAAKANVVLMKNHGVLVVGATLTLAMDRLEVTESAAKMSVFSKIAGNADELDPDEIVVLGAI